MADTTDPSTPSLAFAEMDEKYALIDALKGGRKTMVAARETYLPKDPGEKEEHYEARLRRSSFYNSYGKTVNFICAQPFTKQIVISEETDDLISGNSENVDLEGTSVTQFAKELLGSMIDYGKAHILIDHTKTGGTQTRREEKQGVVRPYMYKISPRDLFFWDSEVINGHRMLTEIRYYSNDVVSDGQYGQKAVTRINQITLDPKLLRVYEKKKVDQGKEEWIVVDETPYTIDQIPLVTAYANKEAYMIASPLLEDLAEMNLRHWISQSEQNNILHVARVPFLFGNGFEEKEISGKIGPQSVVTNTDPQSDLKYVEHTGQAISAGENDLESTEKKMEGLGAEPMTRRTNAVTATEVGVDTSKGESTMQSVVRSLEDGIERAFRVWGKYRSKPEIVVDIDVNREFGFFASDAKDKEFIISAYNSGLMTKKVAIEELKKRGLFDDKLDIDEMIELLEKENDPTIPIKTGDDDQ